MQQIETEDPRDDGQWWQIVVDWVEDLLEQQIPGSVVLLIVAVAFAPAAFKLIGVWITRRRGK